MSKKNVEKFLDASHGGGGCGDSPSGVSCGVKEERQSRRVKETQEQAVALARGGVRYGRVVFHRKGVKLTEDSPRSMLPRDVSRE